MLSDAIAESDVITRYAIKDDQPDGERAALSTRAGMAFIEKGVSSWAIASQLNSGMTRHARVPDRVTVKATWYDATGTLIGEYGLTVADPSMISADTVLIYNENTKRMARDVVPDWKG